MFKKLFSSLRLRNSWNYRSHRWVLFINIACALLALSGAISHYRSRVSEAPPPKANQSCIPDPLDLNFPGAC